MLVADRDELSRKLLRRSLEADGLRVVEASTGYDALPVATSTGIDLAVLDAGLPGTGGLDICRRIRSAGLRPDTPVILVSAHDTEHDRVLGFEAGADDYLGKPIGPREFGLRAAALLRRSRRAVQPARPALRDGAVEVWPESRLVLVAGTPVRFTEREFQLLAFLLAHPRQVFGRDQLLARVWGWEYGDMSTVAVYVKRLRAKLGAHHRVETVWGRGYAWGRSDLAWSQTYAGSGAEATAAG
ncbi:DNA-binding response regulator [Nocardia seriolae]|nr:DNA-binding response regulator [Nocardia seriolae]